MKYRTLFIVVLAVFVGLCVVILGVGAYFLLQIPPVENQLQSGSTPVHVQLYAQDAPAGWPMNSTIPGGCQGHGRWDDLLDRTVHQRAALTKR